LAAGASWEYLSALDRLHRTRHGDTPLKHRKITTTPPVRVLVVRRRSPEQLNCHRFWRPAEPMVMARWGGHDRVIQGRRTNRKTKQEWPVRARGPRVPQWCPASLGTNVVLVTPAGSATIRIALHSPPLGTHRLEQRPLAGEWSETLFKLRRLYFQPDEHW
jgi:hypothetical protein